MSKAFTKDDGNDDDRDDDIAPPPPLGKNYVTPQGFAALQAELRQLMRVERPKIVEIVSWAAGNGDRSENGDYLYGKKRLREIDRRARYVTKSLESAEIVDPARQTRRDQVFFGATVRYAKADDSEHHVKLVGIDEADMAQHKVNWQSPIARALLKTRVGDEVTIQTPTGPEIIEVVGIAYDMPTT